MSEMPPSPPPTQVPDNPYQTAFIIYLLFGGGLLFAPLALGGVIYAYIERGKHPGLDTHLSFQIRTFWWGLAWIVGGFILSFILIGFLVWLAWVVWLIVRIITGIQLAQAQRPVSGTELYGLKAV